LKKENAEIKYECSELDADNKLLRTELNTKEKEKTDLHKKYKVGIYLNTSTVYIFSNNNKDSVLTCSL